MLKPAVASFTRPSNTDAYAAGDVIGPVTTPAAMNFSAAVPNSFIIGAKCTKDSVTVANSDFRLWLYVGAASPTAIADNAPWTTLYANDSVCVGYIDLGTAVTDGSGSDSAFSQNFGVEIPTVGTSTAGNLWGVLVAKAAYVPESGEKFTVTVYTT